ncbi:MAG: helix-turn-helix transcriptional regulator, partial [Bacilli bacterium]|nr:helix-turn-helix transcriptional regulator [Bacilli bacterium]
MFLFDFNIQRYYETNKFLMGAVDYYRIAKSISKKQIQKEANISHATYRRAEVTQFVDHPEILTKIANYFGISTTYNRELVKEINEDFNLLYTYLYLYDVEKMEFYFQKIENRAKECENSILFSIYHFSRLIYYMGSPMRGELDKISESLAILHCFEEHLLDVFIFLLEHYQFCYYSLVHDKGNTIRYAKQVYLDSMKYPKLFPYILYQISLNYYFINDYANSIFYSLEALPKLEE